MLLNFSINNVKFFNQIKNLNRWLFKSILTSIDNNNIITRRLQMKLIVSVFWIFIRTHTNYNALFWYMNNKNDCKFYK